MVLSMRLLLLHLLRGDGLPMARCGLNPMRVFDEKPSHDAKRRFWMVLRCILSFSVDAVACGGQRKEGGCDLLHMDEERLVV